MREGGSPTVRDRVAKTARPWADSEKTGQRKRTGRGKRTGTRRTAARGPHGGNQVRRKVILITCPFVPDDQGHNDHLSYCTG